MWLQHVWMLEPISVVHHALQSSSRPQSGFRQPVCEVKFVWKELGYGLGTRHFCCFNGAATSL